MMKFYVGKIILFVLFCVSTIPCSAQSYVFFLHNKFIEDNPLEAEHPSYGKAAYQSILDEYRKAGFTVISEKRPANADVGFYAKKISYQIDSLLKIGTKARDITVIGTSKGGYIAQYVSSQLKNPNVNYVFIGCYRDKDLSDFPGINFCGNILNIYEESDVFGVSAIKRKETSALKVSRFKEIELHTGLKHGFLFQPLQAWIAPSIEWAKGNYN